MFGGGSSGQVWQLYWETTGIRWSHRFELTGGHVRNSSDAGKSGEWANLAAVYDGEALRLYLDGTEIATEPATGDLQALDKPLQIGDNPDKSRSFNGYIDEVRVSPVVRSQAWIDLQHEAASDRLFEFGPMQSR